MAHLVGCLALAGRGTAVITVPTVSPAPPCRRLWHVPGLDDHDGDAVGTACIGSSEAIMLGAWRAAAAARRLRSHTAATPALPPCVSAAYRPPLKCPSGCLSLKKRWIDWRKSQGKPYDKPNLVFGSQVRACGPRVL